MGGVRTAIQAGDPGQVVVRRSQDVEAILDANKALQGEAQDTRRGWHHVAEIPCVILERWLNEEWQRGNRALKLFSREFDALVFRKLRDPDWQWLRTTARRF